MSAPPPPPSGLAKGNNAGKESRRGLFSSGVRLVLVAFLQGTGAFHLLKYHAPSDGQIMSSGRMLKGCCTEQHNLTAWGCAVLKAGRNSLLEGLLLLAKPGKQTVQRTANFEGLTRFLYPRDSCLPIQWKSFSSVGVGWCWWGVDLFLNPNVGRYIIIYVAFHNNFFLLFYLLVCCIPVRNLRKK